MQTTVERKEQINVKFTPDELARLEALALHYSVSEQNVIRMLIKQAHDQLLGQTTEPARKPRKR